MTLALTAAGYLPPTSVGRPVQELGLHQAVLAAAHLFLPRVRHQRVAVTELALRSGRPDVVVADVDLIRFAERACHGLAPITSTAELAVIAVLRGGRSLSEREVAGRAARYAPALVIDRALRRLKRRGVLEHTSRSLAAVVGNAVGRTVGVEAKMSDWRKAASQAARWRLMFDRAYLVFPGGYSETLGGRAPVLQLFGVAGVGETGAVRIARRPPLRRADAFQATLAEELLFGRWLAEQSLVEKSAPLLATAVA